MNSSFRDRSFVVAAVCGLALVAAPLRAAHADLGLGYSYASDLEIQTDGKIVVAGTSFYNFENAYAVARYNTDGSLDPTFSGDGMARVVVPSYNNDAARAMAIQPDGKIVVVGRSFPGPDNHLVVMRFTTAGELDSSFGGDGIVDNLQGEAWDVLVQPDGKIVVVGINNSATLLALRYVDDGTLDPTFDGDGILTTPAGLTGQVGGWSVAIQPDNKLVIAGVHNDIGNVLSGLVLRYDDTGMLDSSFDGDGIAEVPSIDRFISLALQPGGKMVLLASDPDIIVRLDTNGSVDGTFGTAGSVALGSDGWNDRVAVQADGKIVLVAATNNGNSIIVRRFLVDGGVDSSFASGGTFVVAPGRGGLPAGVLPAADGRVFAAASMQNGYNLSFSVAAINDDGSSDLTFDDDGVVVESDCRRVPLTAPQCVTALNAGFSLQAVGDTGQWRMKWKWRGDEPTILNSDLGTPSASTQYTLCMYDTTASVPKLASWMAFASFGWRDRSPRGWQYKGHHDFSYDRVAGVLDVVPAVMDGLPKASFRSGLPNEPSVLPVPAPFSVSEFFDQSPSVIVQLVSSDGVCMVSEFGVEDTSRNTAVEFKARAR